jgi:hypothetical protein
MKFFSLYFAAIMNGTVDQIYDNRAIVELVAKDGHFHEESLPIWIFPCKIKEGTVFYIKIKEDSITILCGR